MNKSDMYDKMQENIKMNYLMINFGTDRTVHDVNRYHIYRNLKALVKRDEQGHIVAYEKYLNGKLIALNSNTYFYDSNEKCTIIKTLTSIKRYDYMAKGCYKDEPVYEYTNGKKTAWYSSNENGTYAHYNSFYNPFYSREVHFFDDNSTVETIKNKKTYIKKIYGRYGCFEFRNVFGHVQFNNLMYTNENGTKKLYKYNNENQLVKIIIKTADGKRLSTKYIWNDGKIVAEIQKDGTKYTYEYEYFTDKQ